jgi:N-acetylglucosamine-6-phosphate deacetylase
MVVTMKKNSQFSIVGPRVYAEAGILENHAVVIAAGKIHAITVAEKNTDTEKLIFPENYHLVPGFIDLHTHGARGHDVMDASAEALRVISQALAEEGTIAFLATTMTAATEEIECALVTVRNYQENESAGASLLGVHLEGPFLAPTKMGAQRGDKMLAPDVTLLKRWQTLSGLAIKLVTLAPEQPNSAELIGYLCEQKIIASLGHTNATYAEAMTAIEQGCSHATHLFNAMSGIHQREPGTVTAALLADTVMVELILDGVHLHPAIVELVLKVKGKDKILLVTDAMRAKCLSDGCYDLGGQTVQVKNNQAQLANGVLAGSVLRMSSAIQNMLAFTGCELFDAIKMASENPAKVLGIFANKGSIAVNKDADLVVLDAEWNVVTTVCGGRLVYQR